MFSFRNFTRLCRIAGWAATVGAVSSLGFCQPAPPSLNFAQPALHPYSDPSSGRSRYRHAAAPVNAHRLYDFYRRQAQSSLATNDTSPLLPAFPGLDGGSFGHWGQNAKLDVVQDRWSKMKTGPVVGGIMTLGDATITKAITVKIGASSRPGGATFDPLTLTYRVIWSGGFLKFPALRWGLMGNLKTAKTPTLFADDACGWLSPAEQSYHGYYQNGRDVVFHYSVDQAEILDQPGQLGSLFTRTIAFQNSASPLRIRLFPVPSSARFLPFTSGLLTYQAGERTIVFAIKGGDSRLLVENGYIIADLGESSNESVFKIYTGATTDSLEDTSSQIADDLIGRPSQLITGGPPTWPVAITLPGQRGRDDLPYVVDTLPVPLANPYASPLFLTGLDFFADGRAAVATFFGDVWIVSGLDDRLSAVTWRRFATGLNQPLGLTIINEQVHTIGRDQLTRLHDLNHDGQADYYENFFHAFTSSAGSHDFQTGLQTDASGNLYFASKTQGIIQVTSEGKSSQVIANGIRNPNGLGVSPSGEIYTSAQEGDWTPASMIIAARSTAHYGYPVSPEHPEPALPLVYLPRGVDNSTGGLAFSDPTRWGPLSNQLIALSYGYCTHAIVLRDTTNAHVQGGVVPLRGEFLSGAHRARVNPIDGQLYVIGTQGWGTYAQFDGSLQRVRYTGQPSPYPTGFSVYSDGVKIDFSAPLKSTKEQSVERHFAQQWNYRYSRGYGSPEFSVKQPNQIGHDRLSIASVRVLDSARSLFIELPELKPSMQLHLHLDPLFAGMSANPTDLFITVATIADSFLDPLSKALPQKLQPPVVTAASSPFIPSTAATAKSTRQVNLKAKSGLKYDRKSLIARAGETLTLTLENTDSMPHNWVLVASGAYQQVGTMIEQSGNAPDIMARDYVPDFPAILAATSLVDPGESQSITFTAPINPGSYVYFCTFPGHWKVMRGTLIVY